MKQFLMESLLVMLANVMASILIVTNVLVGYKLYQFLFEQIQWTVSVSVYSVGMFLVCSAALTVVFSLLFAYQSTKVEIVQYLKAE